MSELEPSSQESVGQEDNASRPTEADIENKVEGYLQNPRWVHEIVDQLEGMQTILSAAEAGKVNLDELSKRVAELNEIEDYDEKYDLEEALRDETGVFHLSEVLGLYRDYYQGWTSEDVGKALEQLNKKM